MDQRIFIITFILFSAFVPLTFANRTNRNLNLQQLQNRCLTHQSTAAKSSTCITQKKLKMQITRGVENGVFYCLTYEKNTGNVYGFDSLTIELHPDYDLQYSGANVIDYEYPSFKLYDVRVTQEYKGRFAIYSNNTSFKIYHVTINNEQQSCTYGKGKNRQLWPEPRKIEVEEDEEEIEIILTTPKAVEKSTTTTQLPSTTSTTTTTTVKSIVASRPAKVTRLPKFTTTAVSKTSTTEPTTTLPSTAQSTTSDASTTTTAKTTTILPTTTDAATTELVPEITTEAIVYTTIPVEPKEKCGLSQKIIDLKRFLMPYNPGEFPFAVSIFQKTDGENLQLKCSGTIISSDVILTSVNCLLDHNSRIIKEDELVVYAAQYLKNLQNVNSLRAYQVENIVAHEGFNFNLDNNIAVLKLKRIIEFDDFVQPICLPERYTEMKVNNIAKLIGFGKSNILVETDFKIEFNEICKESSCQTFNGETVSTIDHMDLGCGLYINSTEDHWTLIGISSIIPRRSSTNVTFTNVVYFLEWIERVIN